MSNLQVLIVTSHEGCFSLRDKVKRRLKEAYGWTDDAIEACEQALDGLRHHLDLHAVYEEFSQDICEYTAIEYENVTGDSYAIIYSGGREHVLEPLDVKFIQITQQIDPKIYVWE